MAKSAKKHKVLKILLPALVLVVSFAAALFLWLARPPFTAAKIEIFKRLPIPFALVNNRPVFMKDFLLQNRQAAIYFNKYGEYDEESIRQRAKEALYDAEKARQLAAGHKVRVASLDIQREFERQKDGYARENSGDFNDILSDFGLDEQSYKDDILKPQILRAKLAAWFYSQRGLNKDS